MKFTPHHALRKAVRIWLVTGLIMIFLQIILGGITRLTGSGLSITKWEIVTGTLPPLNAAAWQTEFDKYKQTPQYKKINEGMSMGQFKFIYFWEYFHRLWARTMGFVFIIPFTGFLFAGWFSKRLIKQLIIVFLLAALVASVGWIMVASGLIDRPWVNAYKLSFHLCLALLLFGYLFWVTLTTYLPREKVINNTLLKKALYCMFILLCMQLFLGGIMSGMKAALTYPTWPDMNGKLIPATLLTLSDWNVDNFVYYDRTPFMAAFIQFFHRLVAYLLTINIIYYIYLCYKHGFQTILGRANTMLIFVLITQIALGILTVINSKGQIPLLWGVLHQGGAILLLTVILYLHYVVKPVTK